MPAASSSGSSTPNSLQVTPDSTSQKPLRRFRGNRLPALGPGLSSARKSASELALALSLVYESPAVAREPVLARDEHAPQLRLHVNAVHSRRHLGPGASHMHMGTRHNSNVEHEMARHRRRDQRLSGRLPTAGLASCHLMRPAKLRWQISLVSHVDVIAMTSEQAGAEMVTKCWFPAGEANFEVARLASLLAVCPPSVSIAISAARLAPPQSFCSSCTSNR